MQLSPSPDSGFSSLVSTPNELLTQDFELLNELFVKEKMNYWKKVAAVIQATKDEFLKSYYESQTAIESTFKWVSLCVQTREQELKVMLQLVGKAKMLEWERQLKVCEEALDRLTKIERGIYKMADFEGFLSGYSTMLTRNVDFIDSGQIKVEMNESKRVVSNALFSFGKISYWDKMGRDGSSQGLKGLTPKFIIGGSGRHPGEFCRPWGVCSDVTGRIFVSDRCNNRVQVFDESGEFLLEFGKPGTKAGEFSRPVGLTVDKKCRIIVVDKDNHRIQVFTYSGGFLFSFGNKGHRNGQFLYPWDVAVSEDCQIAVSDSKNHRVQLFSEHGHFLRKFGDDLRKLDSPRSLAFRSDGSLLVSDFNNHRIIVLDRDFNKIGVFGSNGTKPGELFRPQGVAWSTLKRFVVSDCKNNRIQVFDDQGNLLKVFGTAGSGPGEFESPQGLCFHPNGNIIVVDLGNDRVQVF